MVSVERRGRRAHPGRQGARRRRENAEYEDAKNEQAFVEGRIQALSALIKNATIIDENHSTDHVQIGSTVEVQGGDGKENVHDRRLGGGRARRGPHLQREPGRPRPAGQEEGRQDRRQVPAGDSGTRSSASAEPASRRWSGRTNSRRRVRDAVRRSSTTPRRRRAPSTWAACAGGRARRRSPARCARTASRRVPLRRRRPRPDGLPGAPDARRHRALHGRAAGARARPGRRLPRELRPPLRGVFMDTFAGLGIHPIALLDERDVRDRGDGPVHPDGARPRRPRPRHLPPGRHVEHPDMAADRRHLRELRQGRDHARHRLERRAGRLRVPAATWSTWATGCGSSGWVAPFGAGEAALERRLGRAVVPVRRHDRGLRQGPGHGRWLARPRDAIAREVFEREPPLNVPYEFLNIGGKKMSTSQGARRRRARHRGAPAAGAAALPVPAPQARTRRSSSTPKATPIPRLFDEFDRIAAAIAGREVKGELPPGLRGHLPLGLLDPARRRRGRGGRVPTAVRAPGAAAPGARRGPRGAHGGREGRAPSTTRERAILDERIAAARGWLDTFAPERLKVEVHETLPPEAADADRGAARRTSAALADARRGRGAGLRRRLAGPHLRDRDGVRHRRGTRSLRSIERSSAAPTGRGPAGCWPASIRRSSSAACRGRPRR